MYSKNVGRLLIWLILYFCIWTINTYYLDPLLPYDAVEAINWARNAEWGTPKNPWLPGMMMKPVFWLPEYHPVFYWYAIHFFCVAVGMAGCWALVFKLTGRERLAWLGMLTLLLSGITSFDIIPYNDNYLLVMLWPWSVFFFLHAIEYDSRFWILFGVLGGLSLMAKYSSAAIIFPLILFTLFSPRIRRHYRQIWIWLGWSAGLLLVLPNLLWLLEHNFAAYHWVDSEIITGVNIHALTGVVCVFYPLLFLVGYLYSKGARFCWPSRHLHWIVVTSYVCPLLIIVICFSFVDGGRFTEWIQPFMILAPAVIFACLHEHADVLPGTNIIKGLTIFGMMVAVGYAGVMVGNISNAGQKMRGLSSFSRELESRWMSYYGQPLRYVGGEYLSQWLTIYATSGPEVITPWDNNHRPNVYNAHISTEKISRYGVLLIGKAGERCPSTVQLHFHQQWPHIPVVSTENVLVKMDDRSPAQWVCIGYVSPGVD